MNDLNTLRNDVREFYKKNDDVFTRPSRDDCILYALTEGGEALDAYLRNKRSTDVRRTTKETDFMAEVGDLKFMMIAATLDDPDEWYAYIPECIQGKGCDVQDVLNAISQLSTNQPKSAILFLNWDLFPKSDGIYKTMKKLESRCKERRMEKSTDDILWSHTA